MKKNKSLFIIVIIIVTIILIYFIYNNYNDEHYDGRINSIDTIEKCADICSSIYNTSAFAYDVSGKCFISKTPLTRPPLSIHPYHTKFKKTDIICNKINYIRQQEDLRDPNNVISNRLYYCHLNDPITSEPNHNPDLVYFMKNKKMLKIKKQDLKKLGHTNETMFNIKWPINRKQLNDIDIEFKKNTIKNISWFPAVE